MVFFVQMNSSFFFLFFFYLKKKKKKKNLLYRISSLFSLSYTLSCFLKKALLLFMGGKNPYSYPIIKKNSFLQVFFFPLHVNLVFFPLILIQKKKKLHEENSPRVSCNNFLLNINNSPITVVINYNKLLLNSSTEFCY